jgi:hypothetical protein
MSHSAVLTPPDVEAFNHILNLAKPGKPYPLDFSDEVQYHFYLNGVLASGMTPERYPQFFKTLDMSRRRHLDKTIAPLAATPAEINDQGLIDINIITKANNSINFYSCSALSSVVKGTIFTKLRLQIYDTKNDKYLADINPPVVYGFGRYETINSNGPLPSKESLKAIFTYSYQRKEQGKPHNSRA